MHKTFWNFRVDTAPCDVHTVQQARLNSATALCCCCFYVGTNCKHRHKCKLKSACRHFLASFRHLWVRYLLLKHCALFIYYLDRQSSLFPLRWYWRSTFIFFPVRSIDQHKHQTLILQCVGVGVVASWPALKWCCRWDLLFSIAEIDYFSTRCSLSLPYYCIRLQC